MEIVLKFVKENWLFITYVIIVFVEIIIISVKKPVKVDSLKERILKFVPFAIKLTELTLKGVPSKEKLTFCVSTIKEHFSLDDSFDEFIVSAVESILSTPEKK